MKTGTITNPQSVPLITRFASLTPPVRGWRRWLRILLLIAMPLAIGWVDYITGWELSLFVIYALPILTTVAWEGRTAGIAMAAVCAACWWLANHADNPYETHWGYNLAMVSRFVYFVIAAIGGAAVQHKQAIDAMHIRMLEERRQLEHDIVSVSEHEQQRIGQDLHDGLCQQLAAIGCAARALADDLHELGLPAAQDASHIEDSIRQSVMEVRNLARGIFPVNVDSVGLMSALRELAQTTTRLTGITVHLIGSDEARVDKPEVAMHLYRIAQEALANAVRHGGVKEVFVSFSASDSDFELRVEDNGSGMRPDDAQRGGMGLRTMRYRAQALGADLIIDSRTGGGTVVCCKTRTTNHS